jgi:phosphoribosylformylglycinamidine cyclo-ligase
MSLYARRGVSAQKEDVHAAIKNIDKGLFPNAFCKILPDFTANDDDFCTIMHADTAGTKSIIAYLYWKETGDTSVWKGIVQDAIVMNIDDMICAGATDNFIVSSTISRNKRLVPGEVLTAIIQGCEELVQEWKKFGIHINLAGGETADVGDLVKTIDVGYTAFSRLHKKDVITIQPQPGDVIVGLASFGKATYESQENSGIGCNGLTSARHDVLHKSYAARYPESFDTALEEAVCYIGKHMLTDTLPSGEEVGKLLLSPTRTYAPVLKVMIDQYRDHIHGIVHCTGGGQTKCMKYIPNNCMVRKHNLFTPPPIFNIIQEASGANLKELYQVFNMGHRLEIFLPENMATPIINVAQQFNIEAKIIGRVEAATSKKMILETNGQVFDFV